MEKSLTKTVYFYYVRHGQTLFNVLGRMQGHCDSPLTEEGVRQAHEAREDLKDIDFARAYTSTSERCIDTAHIILEGKNVPLTYTKSLKEMNWGTYEGTRMANHREEIQRRHMGEKDWTDVGGENPKLLTDRILALYQKAFDEAQDGDRILIISHGATMMYTMMTLFGFDLDLLFKLNREHHGTAHPVPNGFVCTFAMNEGGFEMLEMPKHDPVILNTLKKNRSICRIERKD